MKGSGHGWERFRVVPSGNGSGSLQAVKTLDFEDPVQRQGFKFRVQVSDQVRRFSYFVDLWLGAYSDHPICR